MQNQSLNNFVTLCNKMTSILNGILIRAKTLQSDMRFSQDIFDKTNVDCNELITTIAALLAKIDLTRQCAIQKQFPLEECISGLNCNAYLLLTKMQMKTYDYVADLSASIDPNASAAEVESVMQMITTFETYVQSWIKQYKTLCENELPAEIISAAYELETMTDMSESDRRKFIVRLNYFLIDKFGKFD